MLTLLGVVRNLTTVVQFCVVAQILVRLYQRTLKEFWQGIAENSTFLYPLFPLLQSTLRFLTYFYLLTFRQIEHVQNHDFVGLNPNR
jgi:hypothetical protein